MRQVMPAGVQALWRRWPLVGLLLALTFVAHDAAMAGDAHTSSEAAPGGHHGHAPLHSSVPASHNAGAEEARGLADSSALDGCGVERRVALRGTGHDTPVDSPEAGRSDLSLDEAIAYRPPRRDEEPTLAQGVRRALLQVFLI